MGQWLAGAERALREAANASILSLGCDHALNQQWLRLASHEAVYGSSPFDAPRRARPADREPYDGLILRGSAILDGIMQRLSGGPYEMSDWEDAEPMKAMEFDPDATAFNGKPIPGWASGADLAAAVARQNPADGDRLFQSMARRCNLVEVFATKRFRYYERRR